MQISHDALRVAVQPPLMNIYEYVSPTYRAGDATDVKIVSEQFDIQKISELSNKNRNRVPRKPVRLSYHQTIGF